MSSRHKKPNLDVAIITDRDTAVVARKLASDPEGVAATGSEAPFDGAALERMLRIALDSGVQLWRVRVGDDLFGAVVGDDPFVLGEERMFIWLDPQHRGDDLGIKLVAETIRRLGEMGRERVIAKPPRSNYAALRILNALEFIYVGEEPVEQEDREPRIRYERGTRGGPGLGESEQECSKK
jgi:RimJ/RimL family protein N-acetyltransferase